MKFLRSRRGMAMVALSLLVLFLFRPGVGELRERIAGSIGSALGRKVALDNVRIHILPRPGFDLEGLVIYDDPAFSAEPMVRAQDVSAAIRLRSLFRGRLEIATLSANEPSINLVRNDQGRWNLARLLERSAHIPVAPTGKAASERRPAFPYLEATNARINFKIGQAKKSWALTDADLALWQDGENSWGARLKAQPVRTDFNLTDTGVVRVDASWQRAASLGDTPLQVVVQWRNGQLGQITKLFTGGDRGWRGDVSVTANFSGTPKSLQVRGATTIDEFRRYDIMGTGVRLSAGCAGQYSAADGILRDLLCESPVNGGSVRLRGSLGPLQTGASYDLALTAAKVPLASLLQLARQAKKQLPADLTARGRLDGEIRASKVPSGAVQFSGGGSASDVRLSSNSRNDEITFASIPLTVRSGNVKPGKPGKVGPQTAQDAPAAETTLQIGPSALGMGESSPVSVAGWLSVSGYRFWLRGDSEIKDLYRLTNTLGLSGFHPVAEGSARLDIAVYGTWQAGDAPQSAGTAQLRNVRAGMRGLNPPVEISSAILKLAPETVALEKMTAQTGDTQWSGGVSAPRHCAPEGCVFQFDLSADQLSSAGLVEWFTPRPAKRRWFRMLPAGEPAAKSPLLGVRAHGRLRVNRVRLGNVDASQVEADVDLDQGQVTLANLRGQVFQGLHKGDWVIDATAPPLHYQATGELQNVSMAQVTAAMNDPWATGTGDGRFALATSGNDFSELLAHAEGDLQFTLRNGTLTHLQLSDGATPFPVHLFTGILKMKAGTWTLDNSRLESHDGRYRVSGTGALGSGLNILLTRADEQSWNITGTLLKPSVARTSRTEAGTLVKP